MPQREAILAIVCAQISLSCELFELWQDAEEIAPFVQEDQLFLILYKELYYRHIYARVTGGPTIEQRCVAAS